MSDVDSSKPADRMVRVRLITFDWLPFTDDLSASEDLFDAMDSLSAESVFFESHYLQKPGLAGITEGFKSDDEWRQGGPKRFVVFSDDDCSSLPGLNGIADDWEITHSLGGSADDVCQVLAQFATDDFLWMHFCSDDTASGVLEFCAALSLVSVLREQGCIVLLTSIFGRPTDSSRFESSLPEAEIRAPLWITGVSDGSARICELTGSFDVAATIAKAMNAPCRNESSQLKDGDAPLDLIGLVEFPGRSCDRELRIEGDGFLALRSEDFLLVRKDRHDMASEADAALYAKPEDVWNVSDVSTEYHDIVERLASKLK